MTQQTIGNTVYTVGQELKNYTEAAALLDYMESKGFTTYNFFRGGGSNTWYSLGYIGQTPFPITITALPNPDLVADEWREVVLKYASENQVVYHAFATLQLAMQEVCKADEVKLEWPEDSYLWKYKHAYRKGETNNALEMTQTITTCFLLGGKVSVKGGV
jgi:hypothetical protein